MADCHICFACIVVMMEVHSLATVFESKTMESLNAVGCASSLRSDIFMWLLGHLLEEAKEGVCLISTLEQLISTVRLSIGFLNISCYV